MTALRTGFHTAALLLLAACGQASSAHSSPGSSLPAQAGDAHHVFYLHGQIIENQGIPAISDRYGEYRYEAIRDRLRSEGFVVHAPIRDANADVDAHARQLVRDIESLIADGTPAQNITVIGASKGASIAALASHIAANPQLRFVLLAGCSPSVTEHMVENGIDLHGAILTIRDSLDTQLAGSCQQVLDRSEGVTDQRELVVETGLEHGLIYAPRDEWFLPATDWAYLRSPGTTR